MNIFKCYLSGRVTASFLRKFVPDPLPAPQPPTEDQEWTRNAIAVHGIEAVMAHLGIGSEGSPQDPAMGLSSPNKLQKTSKRPRGQGGITSHGRNLVKDGAIYLERRYGRSRLSFLTCTLPPGTLSSADQWTLLLKLFRQKLEYHLKVAGLPQDIVGVTEVQEKRFAKTGEVALHIHWLFVGKRNSECNWEFTKEQFREWWNECLSHVTGVTPDNPWDSSTRIEPIRKSAAGYLGKYMSKGTHTIALVVEKGLAAFLPSSWYTCTNALRRAVKVSTFVVSGAAAEQLFEMLTGPDSTLLKWSKYVEKTTPDGASFVVGWYGDLSDLSARRLILDWGRWLRDNL